MTGSYFSVGSGKLHTEFGKGGVSTKFVQFDKLIFLFFWIGRKKFIREGKRIPQNRVPKIARSVTTGDGLRNVKIIVK